MLEIFGSVASIIGLSLTVYEKIRSKYKGETGEVLGALKSLSSTAMTWKAIHQKYHPLNQELKGVVQILSDFNNGYEKDKHISDISGNDLKNKFTNGLLGNIVYTFEKDNASSINTLQYCNDKTKDIDNNEMYKIREAGKIQLAESLEKILISQNNVLTTHKSFIDYLAKIRSFRDIKNWGDTEKSFILSKKTLLTQDVPGVIYDTDQVLMALLGFHDEILEEIK